MSRETAPEGPPPRSRWRWVPGPLRRGIRGRLDRATASAFARRVRRETTGRLPSEELTRLVSESFEALYEPDGQMVLPHPIVRDTIVKQFHNLWHGSAEATWLATTYRGTQVLQIPFDLWIYQELVHRLRPDLIIETGTYSGGTARYLADLCDLEDHGRIVTIDVAPTGELPAHDRITYLTGSSVADDVVDQVRALLPDDGTVLVSLDSDHSADHVLQELHVYAPMVTPGSYLIVEDSSVNGHPVWPSYGPGPYEAVEKFLATNDEFEIDLGMERFMLTSNHHGFLRRRGPTPAR
jgi:cephalosporin hydroxylase